MELLPIIYNSLLIAAGLFVITIAISYVSFKFKKGKEVFKSEETPSYTPIFKDKKKVEDELKPHHRTKNIKPSSKEKQSSQDFRKPKTPRKEEPKKEIKQRPTERIERVKDLNAKERDPIEKNVKPFEKKKNITEETRKKKNLNSIKDDPLKRYTDSADDDLHPLKTED
ncbi:MAG: hypothetical protein C4543_09395 [Ignavibacteriales bacterium]|jgi:hypothetical protein|nr:hypothetical protein [Melioribacteraceae bacterium]RJP57709.1 MAG: hypothetical protein C4543_09395 [Ignavibacteriales bacterium]